MKKISLIVSVFNEQNNIDALYKELKEKLPGQYLYEIIYVNDGSTDQTELEIKHLCSNHPEVKMVSFTRNYGHEIAMSAGLDIASGDAVIFMDGDLQHPPSIVPEMIFKWENGKRIVLTKRIENKEKSRGYRFVSWIYYRLLNSLSDFNMHSHAPDFRLIDRYYMEILKKYKENSRLFRGLLYLIDPKDDTAIIEFVAPQRHSGETKYNFSKLVNLGIDSILAFSTKPLRIALVLSSFVFVFSMLFGVFIFVNWMLGGVDVPGLTTQALLTVIIGSANLFLLSIIGEYVGRIHIESKNRPLYTIKEVVNFEEK